MQRWDNSNKLHKRNSMNHKSLLALVPLLMPTHPLFAMGETASSQDSTQSVKEERNVLLNASDATKPREIPIGLPAGDVTVFENRLPAV